MNASKNSWKQMQIWIISKCLIKSALIENILKEAFRMIPVPKREQIVTYPLL